MQKIKQWLQVYYQKDKDGQIELVKRDSNWFMFTDCTSDETAYRILGRPAVLVSWLFGARQGEVNKTVHWDRWVKAQDTSWLYVYLS